VSITTSNGTESYSYDADGARVRRGASDGTRIYLQGGLWEEQTSSGPIRTSYSFNGQVIAQRDSTSGSPMIYLHSDHLGSVGVSTNSAGAVVGQQAYDPWGAVRGGGVSATQRNYTGQYLDGTGLLFYNARYYDPVLARFVSPDTVVPGAANGSLDGVALKSLTVGFVEPGFVAQLNAENQYGPWFMLSDRERQQLGSPMGPTNPQALNRYSYGLNNPVKYTDPSGHFVAALALPLLAITAPAWVVPVAIGAAVVGAAAVVAYVAFTTVQN
jgi:RHS repeat-associated protein